MRFKISAILMSIAFIFTCSFTALSAEPTSNGSDHQVHHPDGKTPAKPEGGKEGNMMNSKMSMDDMKGMMDMCMKEHKDQKMCNDKCMEKCQENMKADECKGMMKKVKGDMK